MKHTTIRLDEDTKKVLEELRKELHITKSSIIRMAIHNFYSYVKKVNGK